METEIVPERGAVATAAVPAEALPESRESTAGGDLERRNRRTAAVLLGWFALLVMVSLLVIFLRR